MPRSGSKRSRERRQGTRIGVLRTFSGRSCAFAAPFAGADTMLLRTFSKRTIDIVRFAACRREKRAMAEPLEKSLGKTASARQTRKKVLSRQKPGTFSSVFVFRSRRRTGAYMPDRDSFPRRICGRCNSADRPMRLRASEDICVLNFGFERCVNPPGKAAVNRDGRERAHALPARREERTAAQTGGGRGKTVSNGRGKRS